MNPSQDNLLLVYWTAAWRRRRSKENSTLVHEPVDQVKQTRSAWQYNRVASCASCA